VRDLLPSDAKLHIIGNAQDQKYFEQMKNFVSQKQLSENVIFHGRLDDDIRNEIIRKSRAIIVPSEKE
jgi:glycosyltransferase involved in cell wall biosynthesis